MGHLTCNVAFCPTTSDFEFGSSSDFHVESLKFDFEGLRCIRLLEDSAPCVQSLPLYLTTWGGRGVAGYNELQGI